MLIMTQTYMVVIKNKMNLMKNYLLSLKMQKDMNIRKRLFVLINPLQNKYFTILNLETAHLLVVMILVVERITRISYM